MKENVAKRKNRAGAFYYSRFVFDLKNQILHKLFPTKKNYNLNLQPKIHAPENCPTNTQWYISNRMIDEFTKSDDGAFIDNGENGIIRNVEVF